MSSYQINIPILYEDNDIVVISKPHGLHTVEDRYKAEKHTVRSIMDAKYGKSYIVHRLDAGTGGVLVVAKNPQAHKMLCLQFERNEVIKEYMAVVSGVFSSAVSVMLPIGSKPSRGAYKINFTAGKPARTTFIPVAMGEEFSLVRVLPFTGRTHQIRVHLKALKHPLFWDHVYNKNSAGEGKLLTLFANKLTFTCPDGRIVTIEDTPRGYMEDMIAVLGVY